MFKTLVRLESLQSLLKRFLDSVPETEDGYLRSSYNIIQIQENLHPGPGVVPLNSIPGGMK